ncbi:MAG TPA: hypothetical protein VMX94_02990 [Armatimonadota bacterium]|nr:hypothetical protein [Armatimonadota bacterium]
MTERVKEIIEMNLAGHYIPLIVQADRPRAFPMYFARIIGEDVIAFPATGATGIAKVLETARPAWALVADRAGGYEAYLLEGNARYATDELDYQLVAEMRNEAPGFPIHGAVVFRVETVYLTPPP